MKLLRLDALVTATLLLSAGAVMAQECEPSKWGADDQIGAANYVTPQQVLAALELVKKGETHPLGRIRVVLRGEYLLDHPQPRARRHRPVAGG